MIKIKTPVKAGLKVAIQQKARHRKNERERKGIKKKVSQKKKEKTRGYVFLPLLGINQIMTLKSLQERGSGNYIQDLSPGLFTRSEEGNNGH